MSNAEISLAHAVHLMESGKLGHPRGQQAKGDVAEEVALMVKAAAAILLEFLKVHTEES